MLDFLCRLEGESEEAYLWRVGNGKDTGLVDCSWEDIADAANKQFRDDDEAEYSESAYRKLYKSAKRFYDAGVFRGRDDTKDVQDAIIELQKERQKLRDERTDFQRSIREAARAESLVDVIKYAFREEVRPFEFQRSEANPYTDESMVVCLSDLHAGIAFRNAWNAYNEEIMRDRLCLYANRVLDIQSAHKCSVCDLVIGGDNISGLIHTNLRLENKENVIGQVKLAVTYIAEFINAIRGGFSMVNVHCVAGNHSRVSPDKEQHAKGENLDELIPFCLNLMFEKAGNVRIADDGYYDESINSFVTPGGHVFFVVHGDKDRPEAVAKNLTVMTGIKPAGIIVSHRHHNAIDTDYGVKIIQNGSVVGVDSHCIDLRVGGKPEQLVFISDGDDAVKCIYDVNLEGTRNEGTIR